MLDHWIGSLSARLWVTTVVALGAGLTALAGLLIFVFDRYPEQTLGRHEQIETVRNVIAALRFDNADTPVSVQLPEPEAWLFQVVSSELQYRVLDGRGNIVLASTGAEKGGPWLTNVGVPDADGKIVRASVDGRAFFIATRRIARGRASFYVQTATSARFVEAEIGLKVKPIPAMVKIVLLVAIVIFGLVLPLTIYRVLRPLREASRAAARITPRHLKTRLSAEGVPSEIKPLINAFNEALARLEKGFAVQQQFLAAAAHELQTPLTLIRGQIELQPEIEAKALLFREIDLMSRQVRQLLHLAEVSEAQNFAFAEVNPADLAHDVVEYLTRRADAKQVRLSIEDSGAPPEIRADKGALFILLKNIVENAINVSPVDGIVLLTLDGASIAICDEGPGIREDYLPFLFTRFWRAPGVEYEGAGLGLAICNEIATAHDWRLTVNSRTVGTRFTVWL
ncbi:ATP-binding protein [Trinickia sp. NRRL B-1857]|uniref:sensor histidine kinase n=1 Tax=Trinickia sp. NRRL B-1857 TaxID=3162879 RepID=UPI003D27A290